MAGMLGNIVNRAMQAPRPHPMAISAPAGQTPAAAPNQLGGSGVGMTAAQRMALAASRGGGQTAAQRMALAAARGGGYGTMRSPRSPGASFILPAGRFAPAYPDRRYRISGE